jgi:hypothetical protein
MIRFINTQLFLKMLWLLGLCEKCIVFSAIYELNYKILCIKILSLKALINS